MDEPTKEQKFSCGCYIVDGVLAVECTQTAPRGELSAERHAVAKPYSPKCARLAAQRDAEHETARKKAAEDLKKAEEEAKAVAEPTQEVAPEATPEA